MMKNNKGQFVLTAELVIALAIGIIVLIVGLTAGLKLIFSTKFLMIGLGVLFVILAVTQGLRAPIGNNKFKKGLVMLFFGIGIIMILISSFGLVQNSAIGSGSYIQAPTFYFYTCEASSATLNTNPVTLSGGSSNGFITAPSDTNQWDLNIQQTEKTGFFSLDRRFVYQICHNNGANCDTQNYIYGNSLGLGNSQLPTYKIPNLVLTDRVYVDYQYNVIIGGWKDLAGAQWYQTYAPYVLYKTDMFNGGKTQYTAPSLGCNFPSSDTNNLLNSITNSLKQFNQQTSTDNTHLPIGQTRNFIGTYVPISTSNVNFVTYNGQQGYCLQKQIFAITTAVTNGGTYQIVDSNFNTLLANSVDCCPGDTQPNQKCDSNFHWQTIVNSECSAFNACAGADWMNSGSKLQTRYNCVVTNNIGKCVAQTRPVDCTSNNDCGSGQECDGTTNACVNIGTGNIVDNASFSQTDCTNKALAQPLFGWTWTTTTSNPSLLNQIFSLGTAQSSTSGTCTPSFIKYYEITAIIIALLVAIYFIMRSPRRRKKLR